MLTDAMGGEGREEIQEENGVVALAIFWFVCEREGCTE